MKRLARDRDFRLLFAGHVTSLFGDRALFVVLGIWALELTGSGARAASRSASWRSRDSSPLWPASSRTASRAARC
jgi:hypothetical protein